MSRSMLTHAQIWTALDRLAERADLSPSGLAKKAGLDPTTYNKSKRITPDGRPRWPSTESVAKSLAATNTTIETFVALINEKPRPITQDVPLVGFVEAGEDGYFDDGGLPIGKGWKDIAFPALDDDHAYALQISGDSMLPVYRKGDVIIVSPAAQLRKNDRIIVKTKKGEILVKQLARKSAKQLELLSLGSNQPDRTLAMTDVQWVARIIWASQ